MSIQIIIIPEKGNRQEIIADRFALVSQSGNQVKTTIMPDDSVTGLGLFTQGKANLEGNILAEIINKRGN